MASARAALIALLALATTAPASAQLMGTSPPSDPVEPSRTDPEARPREHWGPSRWFLSGVLDVLAETLGGPTEAKAQSGRAQGQTQQPSRHEGLSRAAARIVTE